MPIRGICSADRCHSTSSNGLWHRLDAKYSNGEIQRRYVVAKNMAGLSALRINLAPGILDVTPELAALLRRKTLRSFDCTLFAQLFFGLRTTLAACLTNLATSCRIGMRQRHRQSHGDYGCNTTDDHLFKQSHHRSLLHSLFLASTLAIQSDALHCAPVRRILESATSHRMRWCQRTNQM